MSSFGRYEPLTAFVLAWMAKATVLLAVAWIVSFVLRHRSAALRHRIWAIGIVGSLALPLVSLAIPAWHVIAARPVTPLAVSQTAIAMNTVDPPPMSIAPSSRWDTETLVGAALLLWALGAALVALRLAIGFAHLWRISSYSRRAAENACAAADELRASFGIRRKVLLLESANVAMMPMTWGVFRPTIVLPAGTDEWDGERRRIVLSHELAHVRRDDWIVQVCAEALRACFWFHPLAWIAAKCLRQESERACDDAVLNSGIAAPAYATQLLGLAQSLKAPRWRFSLALALARPSNLERRFEAMLDSSLSRRPLSRRAGVVAALLGACLLLPVAALTLSAETPRHAATGVLAPEAAPTVLPQDQTATTSASLRGDNQPTLRAPTPRRFSEAEPKPAVPSEERHTSDAQSAATAAPGEPSPVGGISGTIGDPGGARVPRASVTLTDIATGQQEQVTAGEVGEFSFANLIPESYRLTVKQPGFKDYSQEVRVFPGAQMNLREILLSIGDISQVITVSASRIGPADARTGIMNTPDVVSVACPATPQQSAQPVYKNPVQPGPPPTRIRVGGMVEMAKLTQQTLPIYPAAARAAGMQGTVVLNGIIGKDGTLLSACVVSGPGLLARSAFDAISQWRYSPVLLNGEPVEALTQIGVVFMLEN